MNSRNNVGVVKVVNRALPGVVVATVLSLGIAAAALSGCNTVHGAGADIERGGEKLQNAADGSGR
ncbi:MAG: entericidin A/B family lipoprotein [Phycisphaerales bacterium]|nr:entericidin A/B family lipoprotein [Phycisphaerales bacterium]